MKGKSQITHFLQKRNNPSIRILGLYIEREEEYLKLVSLGPEWRSAEQNSGRDDVLVCTSDPAIHCLAYVELGPLKTDRQCCYNAKYRACLPDDLFLNTVMNRIFPLTSASRPALGPTQPPIQWVPGALSPG
jgi:hypothetical protein